jgi:phage terminase Nu1 subunit (DNA packaging protein)
MPGKETAMPESENQLLVDSVTVSVLFGVTARRVQQLAKEGVITAVKTKGIYQYDMQHVVKQYIKHLSDKLAGRDNQSRTPDLENQKLEAELSLKRSKARIAELDLKELEGNMHRAEDVEAMTSDLVLAVRSALLALPGRLSIDLAEVKTPAEVSERVKQETYAILDELANYQYDPGEYRRRVRERQGWLDKHGGEDD